MLLIPRQQTTYAKVGVVAEVDRARPAARTGQRGVAHRAASRRARRGRRRCRRRAARRGRGAARPDAAGSLTRELERDYRAVVEEILGLRGDDGRISAFVRSITQPGALADTAGYSPDLNVEQKIQLLEALDVVQRLTLALKFQQDRLTELVVRKRIREDVEGGAQKQQRDYFLRKQMDAIRKELGEDDGSATDDYREKIANAGMPEAVRQQAERELARLERLGDSNAESATIRTYLDWLLAVPWSKRSEERLDPVHAREVLDADHEGLDDVKKRITEYLAVRKLRSERGHGRHAPLGRRSSRWSARREPARPRSASRSPGRRAASSSACRLAASATKPRSAAIAAPTSARCPGGSCARCVTPAR